jgi:hypothetical protein
MSENAGSRAPDGGADAQRAEIGEPSRLERDGAKHADERPDLDSREESISDTRKPMGPELDEPQDRDESRAVENVQQPTDPA